MKGFLALAAAVFAAIGVGVGVVAPGARVASTLPAGVAPCGANSAVFREAFSAVVVGLHPKPRVPIPYTCAVTTRNAALAVEAAGQVGGSAGRGEVVVVELRLENVVTANVSTSATAGQPKGNLVSYAFDPATGSVEDFGVGMTSAIHGVPDLATTGSPVTRGAIVRLAVPIGLPSPQRFVAAYGSATRPTVFEVFSLRTGKPIGIVKGSPSDVSAVSALRRGSDGSLWYSVATGARCTTPGGLECLSFVPDSCSGSILRLDPSSGEPSVVLTAPSSTLIGGAVPSPDGELVAYQSGGCRTSYFNQHLVVENLQTDRTVTLGAGLVACHVLSLPSFSADGRQLAFVYGPSNLPAHSTFEPSTGCLAPRSGELVVAASGRSSSTSSWHPVQAGSGCGFTTAVFDAWGIAAVEACGENGLGAAWLVQFSPSLHRLGQYQLAPGSNPTTLSSNRAGTEVLIDEYESYHGSSGESTGPGNLGIGPYEWIDLFDGHQISVAHRYPNDVVTVANATW